MPCLILQGDAQAGQRRELGRITDCPLLGPDGRKLEALEVNLRSGLFVLVETDLFVPGEIPVALTRIYRAGDSKARGFGLSSDHTYNIFPVGDRWPYTYLDLCFEDGTRIHYDRVSPGVAYRDAIYEHVSPSSPFHESQVEWNGKEWELRRKDGWLYLFPDAYYTRRWTQPALVGLRDRHGHLLQMTRDTSGNLRRIESPGGTWIRLEYRDHSIVRVEDNLGRRVDYDYNGQGRVKSVRNAESVTEYSYSDHGQLVALTKNGGSSSLKAQYDSVGRLATLWLPDDRIYRFRYWVESGLKVRTEVTGPNGEVAVINSSTEGYTVTQGSGR